MQTSSAKKNILKRIKQALEKPVPLPFDKARPEQTFYINGGTELEIQFAEKFSAVQGKFSFCANEIELYEQLQTLLTTRQWNKIFINEPVVTDVLKKISLKINTETSLSDCDVSITSCEYLIARTGTIVLSSIKNGRTPSVYAPTHICIAYTDQLVFDLKDAIELLKNKYTTSFPSLITFASGPSRTADIEKTLVTGVHGPKEVFCFLIQRFKF
ncbi:MAG: lactate utilization protein [Parafilimonas sp.]|nr:lactate utilization protein [Parafilimonas sp.]